MARYIKLLGDIAYTGNGPYPDSGDDSLPYYLGISSNYFDAGIPHLEVFDDSYDQNIYGMKINFRGPVMPVDPCS